MGAGRLSGQGSESLERKQRERQKLKAYGGKDEGEGKKGTFLLRLLQFLGPLAKKNHKEIMRGGIRRERMGYQFKICIFGIPRKGEE